MKKILTALLVLFASYFNQLLAQPTLQQKAIVLKRMIELNHISPRPVNDEFSGGLFESFLKELDEEKLFFTKTDINNLSKYKHSIDDELQGKDWKFVGSVAGLYKNRLRAVDSLIAQSA